MAIKRRRNTGVLSDVFAKCQLYKLYKEFPMIKKTLVLLGITLAFGLVSVSQAVPAAKKASAAQNCRTTIDHKGRCTGHWDHKDCNKGAKHDPKAC